jgi:hypothetical protein
LKQLEDWSRGASEDKRHALLSPRLKSSRFLALSVFTSLSAGLVVVVATASGIGLQEDSAVYIGAAHNLLAGHGLTVPFGTAHPELITQYPPLYALMLAAHKLTGLGELDYARWLNVAFAVVIVLVVVRSSRLVTGGSLGAASFAAVLVLASTRLMAVQAMVMSEPAMICLGTLGLYLVARYLRDSQRQTLLMAGGFAGLAALTRYVGVAYGLAGLALLVIAVRRGRSGFRDVVLYGLLSLGPLVSLFVYSSIMVETPTNRPLGFHPPLLRDLGALIRAFGSWAWISGSSALAGLIVVGLTAVAVVLLLRFHEHASSESRPVVETFTAFTVAYLVVVGGAITFLDASIPGDSPRILLPVLPVVAVLLTAGLQQGLLRLEASSSIRTALPLVLVVVVLLPLASNSLRWIRYARANSPAVTMSEWRNAPLSVRVRAISKDREIYSNDAALLYLFTDRHVIDVPPDVSVYTRKTQPDFAKNLAKMNDNLQAHRAALVYFDNGFSPSEARLTKLIRVIPIYRSGSITIFTGVD